MGRGQVAFLEEQAQILSKLGESLKNSVDESCAIKEEVETNRRRLCGIAEELVSMDAHECFVQ
eukprot:SAG31_NODE_4796_length_2952_cov_12.871714_2_plen_63_part_00